ncbi:VCBS domain-containing protein, partial [uncultured Aquimarina sp.]|uniref:VCBS domain-containing protein n=1 Tax=uncultured Aquimarina sp. TaxID=575652 RepID=UPI002614B8EF
MRNVNNEIIANQLIFIDKNNLTVQLIYKKSRKFKLFLFVLYLVCFINPTDFFAQKKLSITKVEAYQNFYPQDQESSLKGNDLLLRRPKVGFKTESLPVFSSKSFSSRSPLDPPTLDLDAITTGDDYEFFLEPATNLVYPISRGEVAITSDTGAISDATIVISGNIDANELLAIPGDPGPNFDLYFLGANNTFTYDRGGGIILQVAQTGTSFVITETTNDPIPNDVFEDFIEEMFYGDLTSPYTEGIRTIDVTLNDTTGGSSTSQTIINIVVNPEAVDDGNSIFANSVVPITGNVLTNDTDASSGGDVLAVSEVNVFPGFVGAAYSTLYGTLTVQSDGSYSYTVDNDNSAVAGLINGTSLDDIIAYTVEDSTGAFDYGILTITVNGVDDPPTAVDDFNSVTVGVNNTVGSNLIEGDGVNGQDLLDRPLSILVWESQFTNGQEVGGLSRTIDGITLDFTEADPDNIGTIINLTSQNTLTNGGHTGYLRYDIDPSTNPVSDTQMIIDFDQEVFNLGFLVVDIDYSQATAWQDQMTIQGFLDGSPVAFTNTITGGIVDAGGNTYYGTGVAVEADATGNINVAFDGPINQLVLSYNYGPDVTDVDPGRQIAGISDIFWQGDNGVTVITVNGTPVVGVTTVATTYGFLTVNPDGTYTYTVDTTNPAVANLLVGQTLTDTIPYELRDALLSIDDANLIITINGSAVDTDMDGEPDWTDLDDENDGILDENECYVSTVLIGSPDGVEDGSFGVGYWDAEYYSGHFAVVGSTFGNSDQNSTLNGSVGAPTFVGEAFVGGNSLSFTESGSYAQTSPGVFDTNSSTGLVPPSYVGTNIDDVGFQPYYQTIFKREADIDGVLTFGSTGFSVDDTFELFINGTRQVFASFCCGASDSPNDSFSFNVNKGDDLEIRYTNLGSVGSFQFNLELTPSCNTDVDGDGTPNGQDLDSDNDGCNDVVESGGTDTTPADGVLDGTGFDGNGLVTGGTGGYDGVNGNEVVATRLTVSAVPANETVNAGVTVTFSVTANAESTTTYTGTPPATVPNYAIPPATDVSGTIAYQWQRNGTNIDGTIDGGVYSDFNSATLTITNPTTSLSGNTYNVIVTHPDNVCINEQNSATLTVNPSSDLSIAKSAVLTTDADGSTTISAGDTVTFSVTVSNAGANDATGVGVGDTVPDG